MLDYYYEIKEHYTDNRDYYVDKQREEIMHLYTSFKKELQLDKLSLFLNSLSDITTIVVMGHSMANVDSEYMEMVEQLLHPKTWYISQYEGNPSLASLSSYSFSDKIQFYNLSDYNK